MNSYHDSWPVARLSERGHLTREAACCELKRLVGGGGAGGAGGGGGAGRGGGAGGGGGWRGGGGGRGYEG